MKRNQRGQVTAEVAVLFAFAIAGFLAMGFYLQRSTQGSMKSNTDSIGTQYSVNSGGYNSHSVSITQERIQTGSTKQVVNTESCSQSSHAVGTEVPTDYAGVAPCDPSAAGADGTFGILPGS